MTVEPKAIRLVWRDAESYQGWLEDDEIKNPTYMQTIAWYIGEDEEYIRVSHTLDPPEDATDTPKWADPFRIPKCAIISRRWVNDSDARYEKHWAAIADAVLGKPGGDDGKTGQASGPSLSASWMV